MKHFLTQFGLSVGLASYATVGSPSGDRRNSRLKHIAFMLLFLLGSLNVWGTEGDVVYTLNTAASVIPIASSNSYDSYADATNKWKITCGAKQSDGLWLGSNNNKKAKMILSNGSYTEGSAIATAIGVQASSTYYAAIIGTSELENVGKVTLTYTTPGGTAPSEAWICYSTNSGTSWTIAKKVTSLSTSGTDFEFESTIASARYAFVIHSAGYCQFKVPVLTFYEGATGGGDTPTPVTVKTLKNIAVSGQTTTYDQFASFSFDGTCTATYSVTIDDVEQDDEEKEVTPTSVTSPDMSTTGVKEVTVSFTDDKVTKTAKYDITVNEHVVTPGEYTINLNNTLYGVSTGNNAAEQSASQKDITVVSGCTSSASTKTYYDTGHIRYYADSYLHISVPSGYQITSIAFTAGGTWNGGITTNVGTYDADSKSWEGEAQEVNFAFTAQNRIATATVTYAAVVPEVTVDPSSLTFAAKQNIDVEGKTFTLTGANLSSGLTLAASAGYSVSPASLTAEAAMADGGAEVTVTPATPTTATTPVNGTVTISGGGLADDVVVNLTMNVTATYAVALAVNDNTMGSATINGGTATVNVTDEEEISLVATANPGYEFVNWTFSDESILWDDENAASTTAIAGAAGTIMANFQAQSCGVLDAPVLDGAIATTYNSATINWAAVANADGYNVEVKLGDVVKGSDLILEAPLSYTVNNLEANTTYNYTIQTVGDGTTYCEESGVLAGSFTTADYPSVAVTYSENGHEVSGGSKQIMTAFDLPTEVSHSCTKTFVGWTTATYQNYSDAANAPAVFYAPGAEYTITENADVTLYAVYAEGGAGEANEIFAEHFNGCEGTGGNDGSWSGSIASATLSLTGWTTANGNAADGCAKFGSGSKKGSAETPSILLTGDAILTFKAGAWNGNSEGTTLNISATGASLDKSSVTLTKGAWDTYTVNITSATGSVKIKFEANSASNNRFFLDDVVVSQAAISFSNYSTTCTAKVETPTISGVVNNETYTTSKTISLDCETEGAAIYYSLDGADAVAYSGSIEVNTYGPHTLTAYATKEDFTNSDVASVSFTLNLPFAKVSDLFTYLQAKSLTSLNDVTVTGVVTEIVTEYSSQHNNVSINIADDFDSNSPQLEGYRTKDATGVTAASVVAVGDKVTLKGNYTYFQSTTHELAADNTIEEYTAKVLSSITVDGSLTKTEYFSGETFSHTGLTATAHYENTGYSEDVTESAAWTDDLADSKVTAAATVRATASIDDIHGYKDVAVTVVSKELESITLLQDAYTIYKGEALPKPIVTAHYVDNDVPSEAAIDAALCVYDEEGNFNQTTAGSYTIKVKYTFGLVTKIAEYEVTVKEYANAIESPYTPVEATYIIVNAIGTTTSTDSIVVEGIVSDADTPSSNSQAYKISIDGSTTNQLDVYNGKYFGKGSINNTNKLEVGDKVIVKGKAVNFNGTTPEIATGSRLIYLQKSTLPIISVDDVAALEVGQDDLDITELITKQGNGVVTLVSGDEDKLTIDGFVLHAVAPGEVTVTANLAATNNANSVNYKANSTTFIVNVVAAQTRYAVTFDKNGADGGDAPAAIANQIENAVVVLPDNAYTYTGYKFTGWKVINNTTSAEVTVTDGEFTMPASAVTIQAQWEQIPVWAYTYTSNVTFVGSGTKEVAKVKVKGDLEAKEYDAIKAGSSNNTGTVSVTLPAGTTALHFHSATWNGNSTSIQLVGLTTPNPTFELTADAGMKNSTPYTLEGDMMGDQYYSISFAALEEEKTVTFSKTGNGDNRFIIYGVNAVYPKITLNPSEFDFGSVRANMTKSQVFTISANENVNGTLSASITGTDADNFEVSTIAEGKVTVTFKPNEVVGENFSANLHVEATNASADAVLTATSIDAATPEISANKTVVDFGRVQPNATVAPQAIAVEMVNIDENGVSAAITGSVFSITPATLTENGNISITLSTAAKGIYEETLTLSAEGAENKAITIKATVASKWDVMYTSNVTLTTEGGTSASAAKVRFTSTGTQYDAIKCGTGSVQGAMQITVPAKTQKLHLHAAAWNGETVSLSITGAATTPSSLSLTADAGVSNSTPFTLANNPIGQAFDIDIPDSETATTLTLTATSGNRFVVYGVNQEGGLVEISGNTSAADVPDNATVVVEAGATLTVDEEKEFDNITVKDGATVTISAATEADNLIVENGGKVTVSNSTTVNDLFIGSTMASGKSGQINGATNINFEAVGDVYFDLTLGAGGTSVQWHAFTVPFPVDALNGVYDLDGNKLTNEVNYAIMDYHGDIRAEGKYGWKKYRGVLVPGTFYLMTVDGERTTYRFKKVAGADIVAGNTKQLHKYASSIGNNNNGWNGVGNPTLMYGQVAYKAQVLNPASYTYEAFNENETNFIVGTPFFIQATEDGTMTFAAASGSANYAPARQASNEIKDVKVTFGNEEFRDKLYISASEDALNEYETGKDLVKMTMTSTPKVAQIFGEAYNAKLCMVNTPMVNDQAEVALSLYAPAAGEYTIAAPEEANAYVYLTKDGVIIWNLSNGEYTADMKQGNNEGYGIRIVKAPNATTGIGNAEAGEAGVQKVVIDNNVYILRGEKMYDATGRMVK